MLQSKFYATRKLPQNQYLRPWATLDDPDRNWVKTKHVGAIEHNGINGVYDGFNWMQWQAVQKEGLVAQTVSNWNHITSWLQEISILRLNGGLHVA